MKDDYEEVRRKLSEDLEYKLKWEEAKWNIAEAVERILNEHNFTLSKGQIITMTPLGGKEFLLYFAVSGDGCKFCGYNIVPDIIQKHHYVSKEQAGSCTSKLSEQLLLLCPNCHAELHASMRKRLSDSASEKELMNFVTTHSYIRSSIACGATGLPPLI